MLEHTHEDSGQIHKLVPHRGFNLITGIHSPEEVDRIKNWDVRDSDIFVITYPKSGTIWLQQILSLMEAKGDVTGTQDKMTSERIPWIELIGSEEGFVSSPSPRLRVSHLQYKFMPLGLREGKCKVIYVARNPKDVLVSYYHFHNYAAMLETPKDFNDFFEKFMKGQVYGNCWFEHVKTWYSHRNEMDFLYLTYEEMIQDLQSAVEKICTFLGRTLKEAELAGVVKHSMFTDMKRNPQANYTLVSSSLLNHQRGSFMRKGTVGDWKNYFTVAQNQRFDRVYEEKMRDVPLSFVWDIGDTIPA
ncbi:amine sulfotransferase-like [Brachyhypopomus gauderio]|uniref:amine sulfotransferase-like n=1 Tax=Brachyhypopomus gauderio TaxID=698409 RepID=UPI0040416AFA